MPDIKFLGIRFRAFAQATESEERVLEAVRFASGTNDVRVARSEGHFGNPMAVLEVEVKRSGEMKRFMYRLREAGVLEAIGGQIARRMDEDCVLHIRLDKQKAYAGSLELAPGRDVIDVRIKIGTYPASQEAAVRTFSDWLSDPGN